MRSNTSPSAGSTVVGLLKEYEGGLRSSDSAGAKSALNAVATDTVDQPLGVLGLDENGRVRASKLPDLAAPEVSVSGPLEVFVGAVATYTISNYDMFTDYVLDIIAGSVVRNKATITYTAPTTVMPAGFKVNGKSFVPTIKPPGPMTPSILAPVNNASAVATNYTLQSSAFSQVGDASTHVSSDWQIATDADFVNVVKSVNNSLTDKTSWSVTGLGNNLAHFARVRYLASNGNYSSWSPVITFTTASAFVLNLAVSADTTNYNMKTAAINAGWNQVAPLRLTVTVNSGVKIGSTTTAAYAFDTGNGFPVGTEINLVNNGKIYGKGGNGGAIGTPGGAGGPALIARLTLTLTNNDTIGGGGGGGGGGSYGVGGGGQGITGGSGFQSGTDTAPGSGQAFAIGRGGSGGSLGSSGSIGGTDEQQAPQNVPYGQNGGAPGNAIQGNSNIAWITTGTRLGPIN